MIWALMFSQLAFAPGEFIRSVYTLPKLVALALVLAVASWRPGRSSAARDWLWPFFLAAFAVSTYFSFAWSMSLCGIYLSGCETCLLAVLCFLTFRAAQAGKTDDALEAGAAAAAVSVILAAFMNTQSGRWVGPTGQAARFGTALAIGAAMAMGNPRLLNDRLGDAARITVNIILLGIVMTGSRGAVLGVLAAAVYLYGRKIPKWAYAAAAAALAATLWRKGDMLASDTMRIVQAKAGWDVFMAHPLVGSGPATFLPAAPGANQFHTHILPLNVLATQGLLGALAWGLLAFDAWRGADRRVRAVYVAAAVCSMFNPLPESSYVVMAVLYGTSRSGALIERRNWPRLIVAHAVLAWLLVMTYADRQAELGERELVKDEHSPMALHYFQVANRWNPLEFYYFAKTHKR